MVTTNGKGGSPVQVTINPVSSNVQRKPLKDRLQATEEMVRDMIDRASPDYVIGITVEMVMAQA